MLDRRWIVILAGVIVSSVALGAFSGRQQEASPAAESPIPLTVETIAIADDETFETQRTYTGVIKSSRTSELSFRRTGMITELRVDAGDRVQHGAILAQLDVRDLQARKQECQAQRDAAAALLDELTAGARPEVIEAARATVQELQAAVAQCQTDLQRHDRLVQNGGVSRAEFEIAEFETQAATARLAAAKARLAELEAGTRREQLEMQRAVVAELDAALQVVGIEIDDGLLRAPFSGTISRRHADEGTVVSLGTPVLRLVAHQELEAWIGLPTDVAAQFKKAQPHVVHVGDVVYSATVSAVLPEVDSSTQTRTVVFRLDDGAADKLVPFEVVRIAVAQRASAAAGFCIPISALARGHRGLWSVYVVARDESSAASIVERRDVEVLQFQSEWVLVRGTILPGDRVVATGTHRVVAGQRVQEKSVRLQDLPNPEQGTLLSER